mmetsp:Transcript_53773/g.172378  ORF Transcript_53773/g.172378 Transcript_53773/m.172378 type:complete len:438 (-) Transcript_53773:1890-3203(-)
MPKRAPDRLDHFPVCWGGTHKAREPRHGELLRAPCGQPQLLCARGDETPVDGVWGGLAELPQALDPKQHVAAVLLVHEERARERLCTTDGAHHAHEAHQVELEQLLSLLLHEVLQGADLRGRVLPLQHLGQVEGLVRHERLSHEVDFLLAQVLHRRHDARYLLDEAEYYFFRGAAVWWQCLGKGFHLPQAADGKEYHHGMQGLIVHVCPLDEALPLRPELLGHAITRLLARGEGIIVVGHHPVDTEHRGERTLPLVELLHLHVDAGLLVQLPEGPEQYVLHVLVRHLWPPHTHQELLQCLVIRHGGVQGVVQVHVDVAHGLGRPLGQPRRQVVVDQELAGRRRVGAVPEDAQVLLRVAVDVGNAAWRLPHTLRQILTGQRERIRECHGCERRVVHCLGVEADLAEPLGLIEMLHIVDLLQPGELRVRGPHQVAEAGL